MEDCIGSKKLPILQQGIIYVEKGRFRQQREYSVLSD